MVAIIPPCYVFAPNAFFLRGVGRRSGGGRVGKRKGSVCTWVSENWFFFCTAFFQIPSVVYALSVKAFIRIDQFRNIKIQLKTLDLNTRLWGINPTNSVFIPQSLALRSIFLGWILIHRNWFIEWFGFRCKITNLLIANYCIIFVMFLFLFQGLSATQSILHYLGDQTRKQISCILAQSQH